MSAKHPPPHVQPLDILKARLETLRATGQTWRQIATEFPGVPAGTLCAISKGREPKVAHIRAALGLPVLLPAPACQCGEVHVRRGRCPNAPRPPELSQFAAAISWLAGHERVTPAPVRVYGRRGKAVQL